MEHIVYLPIKVPHPSKCKLCNEFYKTKNKKKPFHHSPQFHFFSFQVYKFQIVASYIYVVPCVDISIV